MARKGAFKNDDLDDIDDLLPVSPPPVPTAALPKPPAASAIVPVHDLPINGNAAVDVAPAAPKSPRKSAAKGTTTETAAKRTRTTPARARAAQTIAEAHVGARVAEALRQLTHGEKQRRGRGRSYGEVVLDAIEQFETELRQHFRDQADAKPAGRLFSRVDQARPRRRRHTEPPVKIPLAGIIAPDIELLDNLVVEWQAGSRSALVDEALKLYLAEDIARLGGADGSADEADES
ncbi:ribbon-helix-helix domain-containing protein [Nocardia sp. NPDC004722]